MRVLVTGGAGFIGSHVVDRLRERGFSARIFDLVSSPYHSAADVEMVSASVTDLDALERAMTGCDAVIHLAAVADVDEVESAPCDAESVNSRGTLNVLEAARRRGVRRVVYGSTTWVYSNSPETNIGEEAPISAPAHFYTATKLAGELYCKSYAELYGIEFTILRFGIPYGPRARDAAVIPSFVKKAMAGEPLVVAGNGRQSRRFVYVADLADGVVRALAPVAANRIYNLAGHETVTVLDVAETVREIVGNVEITHAAPRPGDFPGKAISSERAERELGWRAGTPFKEGIRRCMEWHASPEAKPSQPRRVLILSADIGEGHDLPARALAADLEAERPGIEVAIEDSLAAAGRLVQLLVRDGSQVMFRWMPWLFGLQYFLIMRFAPTRWLALRFAYLLAARPLLRLIRRYEPDAVVSTYPGATALLGEFRRRGRLTVPTFSAITDLAGLYFWAHPGVDLHFVTHPESIEEVERVAGKGSVRWARPPTSPGFLLPRSQRQARSALGLPDNGKIVLVSGGGWGVGDLEGAIRVALEIDDTTVVCICGHNERLREHLEDCFRSEPRVELVGFTEQMSDMLAAADALVHSTAGLTVLEAIIRGCPVVSYGFAVGHVQRNNRALRRFGLAETATSEADLRLTLRRVLTKRKSSNTSFVRLPSAASFVLSTGARIQPLPGWRLKLGRAVGIAGATLLVAGWGLSTDDSYPLLAKTLDLHPLTAVSTSHRQVGLLVDAPPSMAPELARSLSAKHARASFAFAGPPPSSTVTALRVLGDQAVPRLDRGGLVHWLDTKRRLRRTAKGLGVSGHFFYATPRHGFTLGQYLLGHAAGASPVAGAVHFAGGTPSVPSVSVHAGEVVEVTATGSWSGTSTLLNSLLADLATRRLSAVTVGELVRGSS